MRDLSFLQSCTIIFPSFRYSRQDHTSQFPTEPCDRMEYQELDDAGRGCFDQCVPNYADGDLRNRGENERLRRYHRENTGTN